MKFSIKVANMAEKVVLLGNGGTGKTKFIKAMANEPYTPYVPTYGVEVYPIRVNDKVINFWDVGAGEGMSLVPSMYYPEASAAIFFLDPKSDMSSQIHWVTEFNRICPRASVLLLTPQNLNKTHLQPFCTRGLQIAKQSTLPENNVETIFSMLST